jgi:hypothetical protein
MLVNIEINPYTWYHLTCCSASSIKNTVFCHMCFFFSSIDHTKPFFISVLSHLYEVLYSLYKTVAKVTCPEKRHTMSLHSNCSVICWGAQKKSHCVYRAWCYRTFKTSKFTQLKSGQYVKGVYIRVQQTHWVHVSFGSVFFSSHVINSFSSPCHLGW